MRLLAITPPASVLPRIDVGVVDAWLEGGAAELGIAVLLREPQAELQATLGDPRLFELRDVLAERGIPTLVSVAPNFDRERIAALTSARPALAGVQLRGDPSPEQSRRWRERLGDLMLGRSCHGATPRVDPIVDYSCVAPVFAPRTRQPGVDKQAIGIAALHRWCTAVPRVFALGGVDPGTAEACLAAGATGLAGISLFFGQSAVARQNVAALRQVFARVEAGRSTRDHVPPTRQRR